MKQILATVLIVLACAAGARAQGPAAPHIAEMKKVEFMTGHWVGEASFQMGPGQRNVFSMDEVVESKLGGALLVVEGIGKTKPPAGVEPRVIHHAFGIVSYDAATNRFAMRAYKSNGLFVDVEPKVGDRTIEWSFLDPRLGQVRYAMKLNERGEWFEVGESSKDGATWTRFFEATLRRTDGR
jgi:hypothetical protein